MKKVFILLANGFEEMEAITAVDILRRAELPVVTVSITGKKEVIGSHNVTLLSDQIFEETDFSESAFIILPGGLDGMLNLKAHDGVRELLQKENEQGGEIAAICASPSILGNLGMLEGKEAICYPGFEKELKGAKIANGLVSKDKNILTGKGPGASIPFALKIVETLKGKKVAEEVAAALMLK